MIYFNVFQFSGGIIPKGDIKGQLELRNVLFCYPSRPEVPILQNFNLIIPSGTVMAVVGASGSGKSTITSLLLRFYDAQKGIKMKIIGYNPNIFICWMQLNYLFSFIF